jgi:soluble lytic murein transglycosylase-like protein
MGPVSRCCLLALVVLAGGAASAEQLVLFEDGRTMLVEGVEQKQAMTVLSLRGGGKIAFPAGQILETRTVEAKREPAAAPIDVAADGAWREAAGDFAPLIAAAAARHELDPVLLTALAQAESAFDPLAVSPKGAGGLLQLMPATAERFGVRDVFDASQNVEGGAKYLRWLLQRYEGRTDLALAGYNAGEGAVDRHNGIPPYSETRQYVTRVLAHADKLVGSAR